METIVRLLRKTNHGNAGDWIEVQEETASALLASGLATLEDDEDGGDELGSSADAE